MIAFKGPINKISHPTFSKVFPRKRLFKKLDENRKDATIWVAAPAGAGKTTLIASYLESRSMPSLWYQVDPRDADPATFFLLPGKGSKTGQPSKKNSPAPTDAGIYARFDCFCFTVF